MTTNLVLPTPHDPVTKGVWGGQIVTAIVAVRDTADAAVDAADTLTTDVGTLDTRVTNLEAAAGGGAATFGIPTYATLTDAQAAVTAGTLVDGAGCFILDVTS